jgi:hypothetical protein
MGIQVFGLRFLIIVISSGRVEPTPTRTSRKVLSKRCSRPRTDGTQFPGLVENTLCSPLKSPILHSLATLVKTEYLTSSKSKPGGTRQNPEATCDFRGVISLLACSSYTGFRARAYYTHHSSPNFNNSRIRYRWRHYSQSRQTRETRVPYTLPNLTGFSLRHHIHTLLSTCS